MAAEGEEAAEEGPGAEMAPAEDSTDAADGGSTDTEDDGDGWLLVGKKGRVMSCGGDGDVRAQIKTSPAVGKGSKS